MTILAREGHERTAEVLLYRLNRDPAGRVRQVAARSLAHLASRGDHRMISSLPQRLNDWSRGVRSEAGCHARSVETLPNLIALGLSLP